MPGYSVHLANISNDGHTIISLWNESFPDTTGFEYKYSWLYKNNIYSDAKLFFLKDDENNKNVGVQGISGRKFEGNGKLLKVGLVADFAVSPNHRTLGPGLKLLKTTMVAGIDENDFIYSFPNINAVPVVKRSGYKLQKNICRYAKIIKSKTYLNKYSPGFLSKIISPVLDLYIYIVDSIRFIKSILFVNYEISSKIPDDVDDLWLNSEFKKNILIQVRDKKYINWRAKEDTTRKVEFFFLKNKSKTIGYIAYIFIEKNKKILIVDFFADKQEKRIKQMFSIFAFKMRTKNINAISVEYMGAEIVDNEIKSIGFKKRDERPVFYKINEQCVLMFKLNELFLTAWDEDAV